jgi:hypothetical protein
MVVQPKGSRSLASSAVGAYDCYEAPCCLMLWLQTGQQGRGNRESRKLRLAPMEMTFNGVVLRYWL